ncbi:hypothetical protein Z517_09314 [Fonsecaea pedrosoi CBS 271.37]|uniref:Uncharacterized protein n=1 Tax=Fonsecaea pedrosoi CBS 271.37 TaxID=1442368 RepID=A0A0D2GDY6_9EURO|nr:uncharacterized protein Z517_09314 [Fonsecaea pedrosoi CBS 271.37]KIW76870.1 hypothetical protein Z517_09314 [Fonsecaea pedrosoi CBS 271.37]
MWSAALMSLINSGSTAPLIDEMVPTIPMHVHTIAFTMLLVVRPSISNSAAYDSSISLVYLLTMTWVVVFLITMVDLISTMSTSYITLLMAPSKPYSSETARMYPGTILVLPFVTFTTASSFERFFTITLASITEPVH